MVTDPVPTLQELQDIVQQCITRAERMEQILEDLIAAEMIVAQKQHNEIIT